MNNNNTNIPAVSVSTMVSELGELYVSAINSGAVALSEGSKPTLLRHAPLSLR